MVKGTRDTASQRWEACWQHDTTEACGTERIFAGVEGVGLGGLACRSGYAHSTSGSVSCHRLKERGSQRVHR